MPRTEVSAQSINRSGLNPSYTPITQADGAKLMNNNGNGFCHLVNTTGSPIDVDFVIQETVDGETVPNKTVSVPANDSVFWGDGIPKKWYDDANGDVHVDVAADGIELAFFQ